MKTRGNRYTWEFAFFNVEKEIVWPAQTTQAIERRREIDPARKSTRPKVHAPHGRTICLRVSNFTSSSLFTPFPEFAFRLAKSTEISFSLPNTKTRLTSTDGWRAVWEISTRYFKGIDNVVSKRWLCDQRLDFSEASHTRAQKNVKKSNSRGDSIPHVRWFLSKHRRSW